MLNFTIMALYAKLTIEGRQYNVMECEYEFTQAVDITGRPSDRPRGGMLHVTIQSPDDKDLMLHEWMRDKDTTRDGTLVMYVNRDSVNAPKTIKFQDAYCVRLYEYFNDNNNLPMYTKLGIMAGTLTFGGDDECEFKMID